MVGILPKEAAIVRLVSVVLSEQHDDEWQVGKRSLRAVCLAKLERKEAMAEQQELATG